MSKLYLETDWNRSRSIQDFMQTKLTGYSPMADKRARQVVMAMHWVMDRQNRAWHPGQEAFVDLRELFSDLGGRLTVNHLRPSIETIIGRRQRTRPIWAAKEVTPDPDDFHVARMQSYLLRYWFEELRVGQLMRESEVWRLIDGNSIIKVWWDDLAGERREYTVQDLMALGQDLAPRQRAAMLESFTSATRGVGDRLVVGRGGPAIDVHHTLRTVWPNVTDVEQAPWVIERRRVPIHQIIDRHGNHIRRFIKSSSADDGVLELEGQMSGILGDQGQQEDQDDTVLVDELYVRHTDALPEGRYGEWIGERAIDVTTSPIPRKIGLPFVHNPYSIRCFGMWSTSPTIGSLPLQAAYNALLNRIQYGASLIATPHVWTTDSNITQRKMYGTPGRLILGKMQTAKPEVLRFGPIDQSLELRLESLKQEIQHQFGAHEISHARAPAGITSGKALETLSAFDELRLMLQAENDADAWAKVGKMLMVYATHNMTEPELIRIGGDEDDAETVFVSGEMLRGTRPNTDYAQIHVVNLNRLMLTRDAERQRIAELAQLGLIDPGRMAQQILEAESIGPADVIVKRLASQKALARDEHNRYMDLDDGTCQVLLYIMQGVMVGAKPDPKWVAYYAPYLPRIFQAHQVHLDVHDPFRDGDRYRTQMTWLQRSAIDMHCELHLRYSARKLAHTQVVQMQEQQRELANAGMTPPQPSPGESQSGQRTPQRKSA